LAIRAESNLSVVWALGIPRQIGEAVSSPTERTSHFHHGKRIPLMRGSHMDDHSDAPGDGEQSDSRRTIVVTTKLTRVTV